MNQMGEKQDKNIGSTSDQEKAQNDAPTKPINSITEKIADTSRTSRTEPPVGNSSESPTLPSEALVAMGNLLAKATPPPTAESAISHKKANDILTAPKSSLVPNNLAATEASDPKGNPLKTDSNDTKSASPASSLAIAVPALVLAKRKSPESDSNSADNSMLIGKKRKVDGMVSTFPPPASSSNKNIIPIAPSPRPVVAPNTSLPVITSASDASNSATNHAQVMDKRMLPISSAAIAAAIQAVNKTNIPVALSSQKTPIPSFSTPPGQKVNGKKTTEVENKPTYMAIPTLEIAKMKVKTNIATKKPQLAEADGSTAKTKNSKNNFVTIKIGPIESNLNKKYNKVSEDCAEGGDKKEEKNNATKAASSSSVSSVTTSTPKPAQPAQPPTKASSVAPKKTDTNTDEIVSQITTFPVLKSGKDIRPLRSLTTSDRIQLERLFEFDKRKNDGNTWDDDWLGVLNLCHLEVQNPDGREGERQKKRPLLEWVGLNTNVDGDAKKKTSKANNSLKLLNNLLRHVYNYKNVPEQAKLILATMDIKDPASIGGAIERLSIDPIVLRQDGWTTAKAKEHQGASGGAYQIGEKIWWQGYLGIVIAFVHDEDIGDLWRGVWPEDLATFDLELEELLDAKKKYERKKAASTEKKKKQLLYKTLLNDVKVAGIEHGIILATSYARGARHGVFWPARVLHASELVGSTGRRSKNKKKVDVVFLAPYWNSEETLGTNGARSTELFSGTIAKHGKSIFSSGPMFEVESIDANESCIQSYPYDAEIGLDIDSLRTTFKFLGLPKAAFTRFLDSQRMALGFKTYSQNVLKSTLASDSDRTSAALLEGHPLAVQAAHFPSSVLQLPFAHMLSELPHHERQLPSQSYSDISKAEPALRFDRILEAMKPPNCWGLEPRVVSDVKGTPQLKSVNASPMTFLDKNNGTKNDPFNTGRFLVGLLSLQSLLSDNSPTSRMLKFSLNELVSTFAKNASLNDLQSPESRKRRIKSLNKAWIVVKSKGETLILAALKEKKFLPFIKDWRRCCERIYKHINAELGSNGKSWVITDSRCNLHLTSSECFERAVRLPAALKGIRQARGNIEIMHTLENSYLNLAENGVITRAHSMSYIQKIKRRCMAAPEDQVVALTDDSDGNGGEDTKGSRGTWNAALIGVGAALKGLDMIMSGECLNVFCATRPPGHHAGRELHAMKAVSNGFCILNSVACAALYATAPIIDGGLGLSRVCVIDIDVHHGNGTQDILCSTYDPRFLYVSMHAGGPDINGLDIEDDELEQVEHHLGGNPKKGIFPGRCGDISPHKGVLNIPLGGRVTSHALGTALVTKVTPAVDAFNPEIILISAGFDAHKHDPLNMGGLNAEDFGTLTEVICKLAYKCCSGRVLSIMEGGYGVPCCRPQNFADRAKADMAASEGNDSTTIRDPKTPKPPEKYADLQCLDLGSDLPPSMADIISSYALQKRLDRCHKEGFVQCVTEHVSALARCNAVKR